MRSDCWPGVLRSQARRKSQRVPRPSARMSSSARKKMARRSSSMASLARFITWNGSWTMATCLSFRVALDRVLERLVHVHREEPQPLLLPALQGVEPELEGLLGASVADPDRLAGLQVADDGDELLGALVATTEVLLVDADVLEPGLGPLGLPAGDGHRLGAAHRRPTQPILRRHADDRHRGRLQRQVLLQAPRLALIRVGPRHRLYRRRLAPLALHSDRRVLDRDRNARNRAGRSSVASARCCAASGSGRRTGCRSTATVAPFGRPVASLVAAGTSPRGRCASRRGPSKYASATRHPSKPRSCVRILVRWPRGVLPSF